MYLIVQGRHRVITLKRTPDDRLRSVESLNGYYGLFNQRIFELISIKCLPFLFYLNYYLKLGLFIVECYEVLEFFCLY